MNTPSTPSLTFMLALTIGFALGLLFAYVVNHFLSRDTRNEGEPEASKPIAFPMASCPRGKAVQLLNPGGVWTQGKWDGVDNQWQGWYPLPPVQDSKPRL